MRVLFINQYYPPDQAATAQLLGQLTEDLAHKAQVSVICGRPTYAPDFNRAESETIHRVIRLPLLPLSRSRILARLFNYLFFLVGASIRALFFPRPDLVCCWTDPPLVGLIGVLLKRMRGCRFVFVSQDVYPEVALAAGKMDDFFSVRLLRWVSRQILGNADAVVSVGEDMKERLISKGCEQEKIRVIPNWPDFDQLFPSSRSEFRRSLGISEDAFVVMHSGNIGYSQDLDALVEAAEITRDESHIQYVVVGDGGRKHQLQETVQERSLTNIHMLPYQPNSRLRFSLSAADLHYVSLLPSFKGVIVPSKVYGILAVGCPILAKVPSGSDTERIVNEAECGWLINQEGDSLGNTVRRLSREPKSLKEKGENGHRWVLAHSGRKRAIDDYWSLIQSLFPERVSGEQLRLFARR